MTYIRNKDFLLLIKVFINMEIEKLRIFVNLYETKNYTRTAQDLKMTQPGVSYNIKSIENEIGQKLFIRNKRSVIPTKNAHIFYDQIKPLINKYYTAVQSIKNEDNNLDDSINIGYSFTPYIQKYLPIWIKGFRENYPKVNVTVTSVDHNRLKQYLENNNIDIFLTSDGDASDLHNVRFDTIKKDRFYAIVPKTNALAKKTMLSLTDFDNQNLIFVDNNWTGVEMIAYQNKIIELNKQINVTYTNDVSSASILVNALNGITLGLNFIYLKDNPDLVCVPIKDAKYIKYGIVSSKENNKNIVKKFINFVVSNNSR